MYLQGGADFVCERFAPDALATLAGTRGVAGLDHEASDVSVPDAVIVVARCCEREEVLGGRRR